MTGRPLRRTWLWLILLLPLLLAMIWFGILPAWRETSADLTGYYTAGRAWSPGPLHDFEPGHIYEPGRFQELAIVSGVGYPVLFAYQTPFCAAFFRLFSLLDWDRARHFWLCLNLVFLLGLILQAKRINRICAPPRESHATASPWTPPAWVWPAAALLLIGPPLWNHLRTGQLYLLTALLMLLSWPLPRAPGQKRSAFWWRILFCALAVALKPIWLFALPFRFLAGLAPAEGRWLRAALGDLSLIGLGAALLQLSAGWQVVSASLAPLSHLLEGNIMGRLLFQNQSGPILAAFLSAGYTNDSWGALLSTAWGFAFRWLPLVLAFLILWRNPGRRQGGGALVAFLAVFHVMPSVATYHIVLVAVGLSLLPSLWRATARFQEYGRVPLLLPLLVSIPLGYAPVHIWQDLAYHLTAPAMFRLWCAALIFLLGLLLLNGPGSPAEPRPRGARLLTHLTLFWFWGLFIFALILSLLGSSAARKMAYERERLNERGFALSMVKDDYPHVVVGMVGPRQLKSPPPLGVVTTMVLNQWGAPCSLTPIHVAAGEDGKRLRLWFRLIDPSGIHVLLGSLPLERPPRLLEVNAESIQRVIDQATLLAPPRRGALLSEAFPEASSGGNTTAAAGFLIEGIQPWPAGLTPDSGSGRWIAGTWSPQLELALDEQWRLVASDEGWGYGLRQLRVIRKP